MTDYSKLVQALRYCAESGDFNCNKDCPMYPNYPKCLTKMDMDAAAAIEELLAEVKTLHDKDTDYKRKAGLIVDDIKMQILPKQGEWITHPEVKNIYGGVYIECPFCGEKYVVQNVSDEKFCRNCGADLRAKMEAQE